MTGASGSGKTALVNHLRSSAATPLDLALFQFDSIGVPSPEVMVRDFGSGENWQQAKTLEWIERISRDHLQTRDVILEGQMRLSFIEEAVRRAGGGAQPSGVKIVLVDCTDAVRAHRLEVLRGQPELSNADMRNWAAYLRREAISGGHAIIDTSEMSVAEAAAQALKLLTDQSARTARIGFPRGAIEP